MTTSPKNLLAVRELLLEHLTPHGLSPAEVGIVGDPAHRGGYHCGEDRVVRNDYSVVESDRDRDGLSDYASALDVGTFEVRVNGRTHNLMTFSVWLVAQCAAGTADTRDIREVIYSPDGRTVKRWDRLRRRSSGDDSHLWHTHISFYRDATKAGRNLSAVFVRYLTEIGLLEEPLTPEDLARALDNPTVAAKLRAIMVSYPVYADRSLLNVIRDIDARTAKPAAPVAVDAKAVAEALARNATFVAAIAKAVADEQARRLAE